MEEEHFLTVKQAQNALGILAREISIPEDLLKKTNQLFELFSRPYKVKNPKRINCLLLNEQLEEVT